jgi:hypothetical protein
MALLSHAAIRMYRKQSVNIPTEETVEILAEADFERAPPARSHLLG